MGNFKFEFARRQVSKTPRERILDELERVAKHFNYVEFRRKDFDSVANIHSATVERDFGSWTAAMSSLKDKLRKKGIGILARSTSRYTEKEMFDEMERIWRELGHRPSRGEWLSANPKISYDSLYRHFKGWRNTCLKFIDYKMGDYITPHAKISPTPAKDNKSGGRLETKARGIDSRVIPLGLRLKVFSRDNFRCALCGRSPAIDYGVKLHIDHIIPFSKGGLTTADNLQTLCQDCNIGKGNKRV